MLDFTDLQMMARGASIALLLLWGILLYRDHHTVLVVRTALLLIAGLCCYVMADIVPWGPEAGIPLFLLKVGQTTAPAFFWLCVRVWFNDEDQISARSWLLIAACTAFEGFALIHFGSGDNRPLLINVLIRLCWVGFVVVGLWIVWRGRANDLVEERRQLRTRFMAAIGIYLLLVLGVGFIALIDPGPNELFGIVNLGIPLLAGILCATMFGIRHPDLFAAPFTEPKRVQPVMADDPLATRLLTFMEHQKPHRDETLTIAALAVQLGEQEYRLRRLINGQLGYRNFAAFLNSYRLAEVKAALCDPEQKDVPILTIALDAGFGSLGPFNRAFRQAEGCTPSSYRTNAAG